MLPSVLKYVTKSGLAGYCIHVHLLSCHYLIAKFHRLVLCLVLCTLSLQISSVDGAASGEPWGVWQAAESSKSVHHGCALDMHKVICSYHHCSCLPAWISWLTMSLAAIYNSTQSTITVFKLCVQIHVIHVQQAVSACAVQFCKETTSYVDRARIAHFRGRMQEFWIFQTQVTRKKVQRFCLGQEGA